MGSLVLSAISCSEVGEKYAYEQILINTIRSVLTQKLKPNQTITFVNIQDNGCHDRRRFLLGRRHLQQTSAIDYGVGVDEVIVVSAEEASAVNVEDIGNGISEQVMATTTEQVGSEEFIETLQQQAEENGVEFPEGVSVLSVSITGVSITSESETTNEVSSLIVLAFLFLPWHDISQKMSMFVQTSFVGLVSRLENAIWNMQ